MEKGIAFSRYLRDWSLEDRSIVVAVQMAKAEECGGCGLTTAEFDENPDAYVAMQVTCPWCAMKDRAKAADDTDTTLPGATIRLLPAKLAEVMRSIKAVRPKSARERARG